MNTDTMYIEREIMKNDDAQSLISFIKENKNSFVDWHSYINSLVQMYGCSYEKFGKLTGFSKNTVKSWCVTGSLPRSRKMFIKLSFGLKMNLEETNELLVKYGKYSELYAKDLHDAIIMYVINKRIGDWNNENYSFDSIDRWEKKFEQILKNHKVDQKYYYSEKTMNVYNAIMNIDTDSDFEEYVLSNSEIFFTSYSALICFIDDFIKIRMTEQDVIADEDEKYSWHRIAKEKGLDSSFEIMLSRLKNDGILPKREQLILLGIHLNMVSKDINNMLRLANMKSLYARDMADSLLLYLLRNAEREDPDLLFNNAMKYIYSTDNRSYKKEYQEILDRYYDMDSDTDWDTCIDDLAEYLRNEFKTLDTEGFRIFEKEL